jgi:hypothetical protein
MASAKQLNDSCRSDEAGPSAFCRGFIAAIGGVMAAKGQIHGYFACLPERTTLGIVINVAETALRKESNHEYDAASVIAEALSKAFPCQERRR